MDKSWGGDPANGPAFAVLFGARVRIKSRSLIESRFSGGRISCSDRCALVLRRRLAWRDDRSDVGQAVPASVHRLTEIVGHLANANALTTTLRRLLFAAELLARRRAGTWRADPRQAQPPL